MKTKTTDIWTLYNRQIRYVRKAVQGTHGHDRAIKICEYFESVGHPHPGYTFNAVRMNKSNGKSDGQFAIDLMQDMAYLVATNESIMN
jgi:hypothetical protein